MGSTQNVACGLLLPCPHNPRMLRSLYSKRSAVYRWTTLVREAASPLSSRTRCNTLFCGPQRHSLRPQASDKPEAGNGENGNASPGKPADSNSQDGPTFDLLPLEELQQASEGASEGPIDSEPSAGSSSQPGDQKASGPLYKSASFISQQWLRICARFSHLAQRFTAILTWIPAVARHRKLVKLRAESQQDPLAAEKYATLPSLNTMRMASHTYPLLADWYPSSQACSLCI